MLRTRLGLLAVAILVPACGGGGGGGGGAPPSTPFTIVQRVPDIGDPNVVRTSELYIRLSRAPNEATMLANVVLSEGVNPIGRTVTFDPLTFLLTIDPTPTLNASTVYTMTINAGLTAADGVPVAPETYTFTTRSNADVTFPDFSAGGFGVAASTTTSLDLQWQAATDASAIEYQIFILPPSGIFDPTSTPAATVATLTHTLGGLTSDSRYDVRVRARDVAGNLSAEFHSLPAPGKTLTDWSQDVYAEIISNRCLLCHTPGGPFTPPFFMATQAEAYGNLVNVDAFCVMLPDPKPKRVLPSNSAASFMYMKISMTPPPCGDRMPLDGPTNPLGFLSEAQMKTIKDWIDEGALDN